MYICIFSFVDIEFNTFFYFYFNSIASIFKNGAAARVADATDHGGEGGGQGALAPARGARRARAPLAPAPTPVPAPPGLLYGY